MELISKEEAIIKNQVFYFTGTYCKNYHIDKRYVNTGICYECKRLQNKNCNFRNKETLKKSSRKSYINNKEKKLKASQIWAEKNREKSNVIKKRNKLKYQDKYKEAARNYQKEKRKDNFKRLSMNLSKAIWECLKEKKNRIRWEKFVDYSLNDLKEHLESKFKNSMTWDNYGSYWHLDHIKPLSWFNLETEFNKAWALNNLQPLEASINLSKRNYYEG